MVSFTPSAIALLMCLALPCLGVGIGIYWFCRHELKRVVLLFGAIRATSSAAIWFIRKAATRCDGYVTFLLLNFVGKPLMVSFVVADIHADGEVA